MINMKIYTYILVEDKWELLDEKEYRKLITKINGAHKKGKKIYANFGAVIKLQASSKKEAKERIEKAIELDKQGITA